MVSARISVEHVTKRFASGAVTVMPGTASM